MGFVGIGGVPVELPPAFKLGNSDKSKPVVPLSLPVDENIPLGCDENARDILELNPKAAIDGVIPLVDVADEELSSWNAGLLLF